MDRFRRISQLLQKYNPFGIVEKGKYVSYPSTCDAYVDMMMRIANVAPQGYIDIPLIQGLFQDVPVLKAIEMLHRAPEIIYIPMDDATSEVMDKWKDLLKRLLIYTGVEFKQQVFYAAWPEFIQLRLKRQASGEINNSIFELYYEKDYQCKEDTPEGDSEQ